MDQGVGGRDERSGGEGGCRGSPEDGSFDWLRVGSIRLANVTIEGRADGLRPRYPDQRLARVRKYGSPSRIDPTPQPCAPPGRSLPGGEHPRRWVSGMLGRG